MNIIMNTKNLEKIIGNAIDYSVGFLDGAQKGKTIFLKNLGNSVVSILKDYVDVEARSNPQALHHIYEWYQVGSPKARLYDFTYTVSNAGLSFKSNFKQSKSLPSGSSVPFGDKAKIMEDGIPVTISPVRSEVLVFEADGQTVFTKRDINVQNPGGTQVQGSFEKIADEFFRVYFKQSFLKSSGLYSYINKPVIYKKNFASGSKAGRSVGIETGFKWIANAHIGVE
jgi:hypothetical protein